MSFKEKLYDKIYNITNRNNYSDEVIDLMQIAYEDHKVSLLTIVEFFYPVKKCSDRQVLLEIQNLIRKNYIRRFHNVGTVKKGESVFERYYKEENVVEWLKLLHLLIAHFDGIHKSESYKSNRMMAIQLGYIDAAETNKEKLTKASRKITDSLYILKEVLKVITVEQKFNYGQKGSYHKITANWDAIIKLFRQFDDKADGSIRFRKTIRYRIISLLRRIKEDMTETKEALTKLINKQKYKYLNGLILFEESEQFNEDRQVLFRWLRKFQFLESIFDKLNTKYIIPNFNGKQLLLEVKDKDVYEALTYMDGTKLRLELDYGYTATIKPIF